jgi:hypothetical protein
MSEPPIVLQALRKRNVLWPNRICCFNRASGFGYQPGNRVRGLLDEFELWAIAMKHEAEAHGYRLPKHACRSCRRTWVM